MTSVLIKNVLHEGEQVDVLIENNRFSSIAASINHAADLEIDGTDKAILPPFYNCHTHSAMTLLRGYADDLELFTWLNEYIWPMEAKLQAEDIYVGAKLACLEMIKSGTVFFADMYWHHNEIVKAVEEMGLRASLGAVILDTADPSWAEAQRLDAEKFFARDDMSDRIIPSICPHAIYTVTAKGLGWCHEMQEKYGAYLQVHLSETAKEVEECRQEHSCSPVEYLERLGILNDKTVASHGVHLSPEDRSILAKRGVKVVHNPVSNMKLTSGAFDYRAMVADGVQICLGTDGCSSNNNLDMAEEAKIAALLAKHGTGDPSVLSAEKAFELATVAGAKAFGLDGGVIEEGKLADCMLVNLKDHRLVPNHNLISNLIYSADSTCIDTVICDGKVLMRDRIVADEEKIVAEAAVCCERLVNNKGEGK